MGMAEIDERSPYTPETLAERWECSPRHIRDMCAKGQLAFFRLGRLYRIPGWSVDEIEAPGSPDLIPGQGAPSE